MNVRKVEPFAEGSNLWPLCLGWNRDLANVARFAAAAAAVDLMSGTLKVC